MSSKIKVWLFVGIISLILIYFVVVMPTSILEKNKNGVSSNNNNNHVHVVEGFTIYYYVKVEWTGGLNNNREVMLASLSLAKSWNIKHVVLPGACLKLRNVGQDVIERNANPGHKYLPPYDYIRLKRTFLPAHKVYRTEYCNQLDAFGQLFDQDIFISSLKNDFGMEVVLPSNYSSSSSSLSTLPPHIEKRIANDEYDYQVTIPNHNDILWQNLADNVNPTSITNSHKYLQRFKNSNNYSQDRRSVIVKISDQMPHRSVYDFAFCHQLPYCLEFAAKSLAPPKIVLEKFVAPIRKAIREKEEELGLKPNSYVAVHFRSFSCGDGFKNFLRMNNFVRETLFGGAAATATTTTSISTTAKMMETQNNNSKILLYVSTDVPFEKYKFLENYGYVLMTKASGNPEFNVVNYPFEVMAHVDQVICAEAGTFISGAGISSSFFRFIDLERGFKNRTAGVYSEGDCFRKTKNGAPPMKQYYRKKQKPVANN